MKTKDHVSNISWQNQLWYFRVALLTSVFLTIVVGCLWMFVQLVDTWVQSNQYQGQVLEIVWLICIAGFITITCLLVSFGIPIMIAKSRGYRAVMAIMLYQAYIYLLAFLAISIVIHNVPSY